MLYVYVVKHGAAVVDWFTDQSAARELAAKIGGAVYRLGGVSNADK